MNKEFIEALDELEKEKGIPKEQLLEALKRALESAYKGKNKSSEENVDVEIDPTTGEIQILHYKNVVETVEDDGTEVSLAEMRSYDPDYEIGDVAVFPVPVEELGRIAAQTAKQVVFQTVRDIERGMVYDEYAGKQNEIITGNVQRVSNETVFVSIGRTEGLMSPGEQVRGERYTVSSRLKFFIVDVRKSQKGPQIFLSRSHPGLVKRLFEIEVPEIQDGIVNIESLAREAGSRTKMAVSSSDDNVDPVGACVGNRGARVQAVVDEIFGEKIDIIPWNDNQEDNIMNALSPAKVEKIVLEEGENTATAIVPDYQLSLAIGKEGQNVRLAAKLCGIKIDIKSHTQYYGAVEGIGSLDGELDDEGYLNPDDFLSDDSDDSDDAEAGESAEAAVEAEAGDDPDAAAEDAAPEEFAQPETAGNAAEGAEGTDDPADAAEASAESTEDVEGNED